MLRNALLLLLFLLLIGCEIKQPTPLENRNQIEKLTTLLVELDSEHVSRFEAKDLAKNSIVYAQ